MTKHIVIILALLLVAGAGYALPIDATGETWATEEELLSAPGSAGYAVDEEPLVEDELESPVCDCDSDEGEDGFDRGEPDPGDGDDGADPGPDDDEPGC
jgi:hypothetical protein